MVNHVQRLIVSGIYEAFVYLLLIILMITFVVMLIEGTYSFNKVAQYVF